MATMGATNINNKDLGGMFDVRMHHPHMPGSGLGHGDRVQNFPISLERTIFLLLFSISPKIFPYPIVAALSILAVRESSLQQ